MSQGGAEVRHHAAPGSLTICPAGVVRAADAQESVYRSENCEHAEEVRAQADTFQDAGARDKCGGSLRAMSDWREERAGDIDRV